MSTQALITALLKTGILFQSAAINETHAIDPPPDTDHFLYAHNPLWNYENPVYSQPFSSSDAKPIFATLPQHTSLTEAVTYTRLLIFLGAGPTATLRSALSEPHTLVLIFESNPDRVAQTVEHIGLHLFQGKAHIFLGAIASFQPALSASLPPSLFKVGFPVFFTLPAPYGLPQDEIDTCIQLLELLFFRHVLYPLSGHANKQGRPLRPMTRGLYYDQQLHYYQNISDYLQHPDISVLRKAFLRETAILIAAGPDLQNKLDYLRANRDKAVLICVNTALKPLLKAGIHPHFVIINDHSLDSGRSLADLPSLDDVHLVGHALSDLGGQAFTHKYLFTTYRPELFGERPALRLHGSVITTAFSLARHMGCARCILIGAQLCSDNPWTLTYSKGSIHEHNSAGAQPLINRFPQLVPVSGANGEKLYTSLNFLDAAHWFLDEIRASGIECINTCSHSIIHGAPVIIDPEFDIPESPHLHRRFRQLSRIRPSLLPKEPALISLTKEHESWKKIRQACADILLISGPEFLSTGQQALHHFDQGNISYLVQRFSDFNNRRFHSLAFSDAPSDQEEGLRYFFAYVEQMSETFINAIEHQLDIIDATA